MPQEGSEVERENFRDLAVNNQAELERIKAGASLVQLYTGLIYRGPELATECIDTLCGAHA